jgi:TetR/AcrR family transcriptional repressor of nem operon
VTRYDREHKQRTRASIVDAASQAFRGRGIEQVSVGEVMAAAGLTHGGFYAHFDSKEQLVAEACATALLQAASSKRTLPEYIRSYLSRSHRDGPETGCGLPALGGEIGRHTPDTRQRFTEAAQTYVDRVAELLPEGTDPEDAWALFAGMAGTVMLARAVDDRELSDRILLAGRRVFARAFRPEVEKVQEEADR